MLGYLSLWLIFVKMSVLGVKVSICASSRGQCCHMIHSTLFAAEEELKLELLSPRRVKLSLSQYDFQISKGNKVEQWYEFIISI